MANEPFRHEIRTAALAHSIWQPPLDEVTFRQTAVELALASNECPVDADIGLNTPHDDTCLFPGPTPTPKQPRDHSRYLLSLHIEHRLANDFALISATQEAVFSVTAACIEEQPHPSASQHLGVLTLRLAANEGISDSLKASLLEIWSTLSSQDQSTSIQRADLIFDKIIYLNRTRILQRARKAVGHPPIFREKGRLRTNKDDKLLRAFARMRKENLTPDIGEAFVERATALNAQLLALLETMSVDDAEHAAPEVLTKLGAVSKACFNVTTSCGEGQKRLPFKHLLAAAGLDQKTWLKNKHVVEIDKIGAYWRIAQSLVHIFRKITKGRPASLPSLELRIEGVQPYKSIVQGPSIQGRDMACYIHAEIQLLVHYLSGPGEGRNRAQPSPPPPRVIGASKSACFLCYLCISCHGGMASPATHGRLYDQWTIPDLAEYTPDQVAVLRHTIAAMHEAMLRLRAAYSLKRPRDFPMTSRTDLDRVSMFTAEDSNPAEEGIQRRGSGSVRTSEAVEGPEAIDHSVALHQIVRTNVSRDFRTGSAYTGHPGLNVGPASSMPLEKEWQAEPQKSPSCSTTLITRLGSGLRKLLHIEEKQSKS
ncbi:uncharacterized protein HMPREF1541_03081 [Cyphellophora europaea CBS 101466]|uniref:Uncharacterized protein n=1 Tax=Cyphellophora europaea (strain CBS 101466) TaxID=1220924 RepID=W2RX96_CYPE1|nr:uncharacterized protein HMPREF1541_03081 [Cyphellophora europaea CBS 101466]ETN41146.1 hypothetical protein HMPREF1541_03081 [Cyphellophora europaea CBS 101466]